MKPVLLAIMGPTASGKTAVAEQASQWLDARILSADAFQVYRGLDIGTAKPKNRERYELLDVCEPNEQYGLGEWLKGAQEIVQREFLLGNNLIVTGGTGLYIRALFEEYASISEQPDLQLRERLNQIPLKELREKLTLEHPQVAARTDLANPVRVRRALEKAQLPMALPFALPPFTKLKLAINPPVEALIQQIELRSHEMVQNGWIQEVEQLRSSGFAKEDPGVRAIGYRDLWDYLDQNISLDEAIEKIIVQTRRYAKRQRTWLRSEPNLAVVCEGAECSAVRKAMERVGMVLR